MNRATKLSSIALCACFLLMLCLTLGVKVLTWARIPLPEWVNTVDNPARLEGRPLSTATNASAAFQPRAFFSGELQDSLSQMCSDAFPLRDLALLTNGAIQRVLIQIANLPTGFHAIPGFFGSTYAIDYSDGLVVPIAYKVDEGNVEAMRRFATYVNAVQEQCPDVTFVYDQLCDPYTSNYNPTYPLQTEMYDYEIYEKNIGEVLDGSVIQIWDPISSFEEYRTQWFTTEHHWKLERALETYNTLAAVLDWEPVSYSNPIKITDSWFGANASHALTLEFDDELWDLPSSFENLTTYIDGEEAEYGKRESILNGDASFEENGGYGFYNKYFGPNPREVVYVNSTISSGKACLLLGISYSNPLNPYIAQNYKTTIVLDVANEGLQRPISEYIEEYGVTDCIIQLGMTSYEAAIERASFPIE